MQIKEKIHELEEIIKALTTYPKTYSSVSNVETSNNPLIRLLHLLMDPEVSNTMEPSVALDYIILFIKSSPVFFNDTERYPEIQYEFKKSPLDFEFDSIESFNIENEISSSSSEESIMYSLNSKNLSNLIIDPPSEKPMDLYIIYTMLKNLINEKYDNLLDKIFNLIIELIKTKEDKINISSLFILVSHLFASLKCSSKVLEFCFRNPDENIPSLKDLYFCYFNHSIEEFFQDENLHSRVIKEFNIFLHPNLINKLEYQTYFKKLAELLLKLFQGYFNILYRLNNKVLCIILDTYSYIGDIRILDILNRFALEISLLDSQFFNEKWFNCVVNSVSLYVSIKSESEYPDSQEEFQGYEDILRLGLEKASNLCFQHESPKTLDMDILNNIACKVYQGENFSLPFMSSLFKVFCKCLVSICDIPISKKLAEELYHSSPLSSSVMIYAVNYLMLSYEEKIGLMTKPLFNMSFDIDREHNVVSPSSNSSFRVIGMVKRFKVSKDNKALSNNGGGDLIKYKTDSIKLDENIVDFLEGVITSGSFMATIESLILSHLASSLLTFYIESLQGSLDLSNILAFSELFLKFVDKKLEIFHTIIGHLYDIFFDIIAYLFEKPYDSYVDFNYESFLESLKMLSKLSVLLLKNTCYPKELINKLYKCFGLIWSYEITKASIEFDDINHKNSIDKLRELALNEVCALIGDVNRNSTHLKLDGSLYETMLLYALRGLATLSMNEEAYIKAYVLIYSLSDSASIQLKLESRRLSPFFINEKPFSTIDFLIQIVYDFYRPSMNSSELDAVSSKNVGYLACATTELCAIDQMSLFDDKAISSASCKICDSLCNEKLSLTSLVTRSSGIGKFKTEDNINRSCIDLDIIELMDWNLYFIYLEKEDHNIIQNMLCSLYRIISHSPPINLSLSVPQIILACAEFVFSEDLMLKNIAMTILLQIANSGEDISIIHSNHMVIFNIIKELLEKSNLPIHMRFMSLFLDRLAYNALEETLVDIINMLFGFLIDADNSSVSTIAGLIKDIARIKRLSLESLFEPVWRSLTSLMLKDLNSKCVGINTLSILFGLDFKAFIKKMYPYLLPHIILNKRYEDLDLLCSFTTYIPENNDPNALKISIASNNLHYILSVLLLDIKENREQMQYLAELISSGKDKLDFNSVVLAWLHDLIFMLAVELGNISQGITEKAKKALRYAASLEANKEEESESVSFSEFLESKFMMIVSKFNIILHNLEEHQYNSTHLKLIRAMDLLIIEIQGKVCKFIPEVQSFLKMILVPKPYRLYSLCVWETFVFALSDPEIGQVSSMVTVTLTELYHELSDKEKEIVIRILDNIFFRHKKDYRQKNNLKFDYMEPKTKEYHLKCLGHISLLSNIPEFEKYNSIINSITSKLDLVEQVEILINSINQESKIGRIRAMTQLHKFLKKSQPTIIEWALETPINPIIKHALTTLSDLFSQQSVQDDEETKYLAISCFGIIGAVDPDRLNIEKNNNDYVELFDPSSKNSCMTLASNLITSELVPLYEKAEVTNDQICIAHSLQNLMGFCGFTLELINQPLNETNQSLSKKLWCSYPETTQSLLIPFIKSQFYRDGIPRFKQNYPIYKSNMDYSIWIRFWTIDLIQKVDGEYLKNVFEPCFYVCKISTNVSKYLLPHLVLSAILSKSAELINNIIKEMNEVLDKCSNVTVSNSKDIDKRPTQLVLLLVDSIYNLSLMRRKELFEEFKSLGKRDKFPQALRLDKKYNSLEKFLNSILNSNLVDAAIKAECYYSALFYLEKMIEIQKGKGYEYSKDLGNLYNKLHYIYYKLDDEDGLKGVNSNLLSSTMEMQLREHESGKKWHEVQTCYETLTRSAPSNIGYQIGLAKCLENLGYYGMAKSYINGLWDKYTDWESDPVLNQIFDEASWRCSSWDLPNEYLEEKEPKNPDKSLGGVLLSIQKQDEEAVNKLIISTKKQLIPEFSNIIVSSYYKSYEILVWFHMLNEIEDFNEAWKEAYGESGKLELIEAKTDLWKSRLALASSSFKTQEKLLNLQRILVTMASTPSKANFGTQVNRLSDAVKEACALNLIQSSKVARKAGYFQTSLNIIQQFPESSNPTFAMEIAKWHWAQNDGYTAMAILKKKLREVEYHYKQQGIKTDAIPKEEKVKISNARRLLTKYMIETNATEYNKIIEELKKSIEDQPRDEKGYYTYASYMLSQMENTTSANFNRDQFLIKVKSAIENTLYCLMLSSNYVYQLLPRIITCWLDCCEQNEEKVNPIIYEINQLMEKMSNDLQPYLFLTVLSQIISRICVKSQTLLGIIKNMGARTLLAFPQQTLWALIDSFKSKDVERSLRCQTILKIASGKNQKVKLLSSNIVKFAKALLKLSQFKAPSKVKTLTLGEVLPDYENPTYSLLVPLRSQLSFKLPSTYNSKHDAAFAPFQGLEITIKGIMPELRVMPSLMRPIRFDIMGSDGRRYGFLCKPKDDLRKDARVMEFCSFLNILFNKSPEARHRQINIRTFSALPLNEECGLIEWVDYTKCIRHIINDQLALKGVSTSNLSGELSSILDSSTIKAREERIETFKKVLKRFPPVLNEFFTQQFEGPHAWYRARTRYARTHAVMAMVGYIVGLGDRHGENLLLDTKSGDLIHVDFSCLFEKGLELQVPERVPFRMTQNMVAAMGPTGLDGVFRATCQVTLKILRNNRHTLKSFLEAFLHDPLVDFKKPLRRREVSRIGSDPVNEERARFIKEIEKNLPYPLLPLNAPANSPTALWALKRISDKLMGKLYADQILSVEGQVDYLIEEATDMEKLFLMYIGWGAYL